MRWKYFIPAILYMGLIFYISSIPAPEIPGIDFDPEKFIPHTVEYSILGLLLFFGFRGNFRGRYMLLLILIIGTIYGISDEMHQSFVPGRVFSFGDIVADSFGSFVGGLIYIALRRFKEQRQGLSYP